ncbi:MAG: hypothetical protein H6Q68_3370 [Firmicutes bacterium]|nr:hypothetical protein [Bacillota bacterium]
MGATSGILNFQNTTLVEPFEQLKSYCLSETSKLTQHVDDAGLKSDWNDVEACVAHLVIASTFYGSKYVRNDKDYQAVVGFICATFMEMAKTTSGNTLGENELIELFNLYDTRQKEYRETILTDLRTYNGADFPELSNRLSSVLLQSAVNVSKVAPIINNHLKAFVPMVNSATS